MTGDVTGDMNGGGVGSRRAVVVGGGSGTGAACAVRRASDGYAVVVADRDLGAAESVAARLAGDGHVAREVEVTDEASVAALFEGLDVVHAVRRRWDGPLFAYNVSGEYAMVKAAERAGWIDGRRVTLETLRTIARAGADGILTYHAIEAARWLRDG